MRTPSRTLTGQELEIMKVVWDLRQATVRDVYEKLREQRPIAYTTVMTMMNILEQKAFLKKRPAEGRAYIYQSARPRKQVIRSMVREFVDRVFNGSAEPLVVHLVEDRRLSERELREIARMIEEEE
ncbi:MAG TPA: BlaI/MecI/CopY family transcriptional regulator [Terriglobia bacterium]|nr:BlaI/MecI/CopY family transcriptional regulator [Terriglobia bacterium]